MLDPIIPGFDREKRRLEERTFVCLQEVARFLASEARMAHSDWLALEIRTEEGKIEIVQSRADALRAMIIATNLEPSPN